MASLSESEELELLELENKNSSPPSFQDQIPGILKQAGQKLATAGEAGLETVYSPLQVMGEAIRGAGEGEPLQVATAHDPRGFRAPSILQRIMPSLKTPQPPADPFQKAYQGLEGIANLPGGIDQAAQVVKGEPDTAAKLGGLALSIGTANTPLDPYRALANASKTESAIGAGQTLKKAWSKLGEATTGKSAQKVTRLIEDPSVILPESLGGAKSVPEASAEYGQALGQEDLHKPSFNPFQGNGPANDVGSKTWLKWKAGKSINPQEAFEGTQAVKYAMPAAITERNSERVRDLMQFKEKMDDILTTQKGAFKEASENYGRAKLKEDFSQWLPRTQTGKISTVKSFLLPALTDAARLKFLAASSPKIFGAGTAAAVGAGRGAQTGLNMLADDPVIRQTLLQVLQRLRQNKQEPPQ